MEFRKITKTAYLELSNIVERAIFKVEGKGKSTIYTLEGNEKVMKVM